MIYNDHIKHTLENFYLCTHIPIKAILIDGQVTHSFGYNKEFEELFNNNDVYRTLKDMISKNHDDNFVTFTFDNFCFTACCIDIDNRTSIDKVDKGLYILGPYVSDALQLSKKSNLIYKPYSCIKHIVSLLYDIEKDKPFKYENQYVKEAIAYTELNYSKSLSLVDISCYLNINKCYFCSLFKNEVGKTYSEFLNQIRIEKSKALLKDRDLSIFDVALSVGFNNQNYFNKIFKKLTNKTPLEFRKAK